MENDKKKENETWGVENKWGDEKKGHATYTITND